jgi:phage terminase small subunit
MADKTIRLTRKQRLFVNNYVRCLNATEAARASGYGNTYSSAAVAGHQLLKKPKIKSEVTRLLEKRTIPESEVISRLADMATASMEDFINPSSLSGRVEINLAKARQRGKLHLLKKFKRKIDGSVEIELHDSQAALDKLVRIYGINAPTQIAITDWRHDFVKHARNRVPLDAMKEALGIALLPAAEAVIQEGLMSQDELRAAWPALADELFGRRVAVAEGENVTTPTAISKTAA